MFWICQRRVSSASSSLWRCYLLCHHPRAIPVLLLPYDVILVTSYMLFVQIFPIIMVHFAAKVFNFLSRCSFLRYTLLWLLCHYLLLRHNDVILLNIVTAELIFNKTNILNSSFFYLVISQCFPAVHEANGRNISEI